MAPRLLPLLPNSSHLLKPIGQDFAGDSATLATSIGNSHVVFREDIGLIQAGGEEQVGSQLPTCRSEGVFARALPIVLFLRAHSHLPQLLGTALEIHSIARCAVAHNRIGKTVDERYIDREAGVLVGRVLKLERTLEERLVTLDVELSFVEGYVAAPASRVENGLRGFSGHGSRAR